MSTTTPTADPFSTDRLPGVPGGQLPPELLAEGSPFAQLGADFERLSAEHAEAIVELRKLVNGRHKAQQEDAEALAAAMASGKRDPGDPATGALAEKCERQRRRIEGLADATHAVFRRLKERLEDDEGASWGDDIRAGIGTSAARVEELLGELGDVLDAIDAPARALHWLDRVRAVNDGPASTSLSGVFPSLQGAQPPIQVYGHPAPRGVVLDAIRETVGDAQAA